MKLIVFLLFISSTFAFECSNYSPNGCKECVAHVNSITDGCVWCGSVNQTERINGNCYSYGDINQACQNVKNYITEPTQIYQDIKKYDCCQQFRIGSNTKITCSSDFPDNISTETKNILLIYFVYAWIIGFTTIFYILISWKRTLIFSFINSILCPLLFFAIFFIDFKPHPNENFVV